MPEFDQTQRYRRYGALMRPYLNQPVPVMFAAHRLASVAVGSSDLQFDEIEQAKETLRSAGLHWNDNPKEQS